MRSFTVVSFPCGNGVFVLLLTCRCVGARRCVLRAAGTEVGAWALAVEGKSPATTLAQKGGSTH